MWLRRILLIVLTAALVAPAITASAADPYAADPNRLVPFMETTQQTYSTGADDWEVWVCQVPGWTPQLDLATVVSRLNTTITPYFEWLSGGVYQPTFRAGGVVSSNDTVAEQPSTPEALFAPECESAVGSASTSSPNGALIVVDAGFDEGYAKSGGICPEAPFTGCTTTYPSNGRVAVVAAATVTTVSPLTSPQWITVAHEIGHALNMPHSYSGLTTDPVTGLISKYDNPMDVMSGAIHSGPPIGMITYDRYAAGWIDPADVAVHTAGLGIYDLAGIGGAGTEMLVIPSTDAGRFFTLGTRRKTSYDAPLPKAGIEVYEIDQRREIACTIPDGWPQTWPCFATLVRITPHPAQAGETAVAHVISLDEKLTVGGFTVTVTAASSAAITVRVAEVESGTFVDDDGNIHELNIEKIATAGITKGCNPPVKDRYCPDQSVTRAEMAVFLIQALGEADNLPTDIGRFPDVTAQDWFAPYVERLAELGLTSGFEDGSYRPSNHVTRAEMAAFLVKAFGPATLPPPTGIFGDVAISAWYADDVEQLYAMGVTAGCRADPLAYCPTDPVKRDQMATFLATALGL